MESQTDIPEEEHISVPYIVDEQGRIKIVATVTVTMDIRIGLDDSEDESA